MPRGSVPVPTSSANGRQLIFLSYMVRYSDTAVRGSVASNSDLLEAGLCITSMQARARPPATLLRWLAQDLGVDAVCGGFR